MASLLHRLLQNIEARTLLSVSRVLAAPRTASNGAKCGMNHIWLSHGGPRITIMAESATRREPIDGGTAPSAQPSQTRGSHVAAHMSSCTANSLPASALNGANEDLFPTRTTSSRTANNLPAARLSGICTSAGEDLFPTTPRSRGGHGASPGEEGFESGAHAPSVRQASACAHVQSSCLDAAQQLPHPSGQSRWGMRHRRHAWTGGSASLRTGIPCAEARRQAWQLVGVRGFAADGSTEGYGNNNTERIVQELLEQTPKKVVMHTPAEQLAWEAILFKAEGQPEAVKATADALGLEPRDVNLFVPHPQGLSNQRASLTPRGRSILFRTEVVRALVRATSVHLFPCKREKDTLHVAKALQLSLYHNVTGMPFEMRALEALLADTVWQFERRFRQLKLLAEGIEEEVGRTLRFSSEQASVELQRLLPIQRALTEMQHDVREARQAVQEVVDTDKLLRGVCLSESATREKANKGHASPKGDEGSTLPITPHMRLAAGLLEPYERQIHSVEGALKEMQENMDVVRDVWSMQLAATRNRIIRINMLVTIASFSTAMACTVPASFLGMNTVSGLEENTNVFWLVVFGGMGTAAAMFAIMFAYWRYWPNWQHQQRVTDMRALRDLLLNHLDDLEDIIEAIRARFQNGVDKVSREDFQKMVDQVVGPPAMRPDEVDLLYRVFDTNHDNYLEAGELMRAHEDVHSKFDDVPPEVLLGQIPRPMEEEEEEKK